MNFARPGVGGAAARNKTWFQRMKIWILGGDPRAKAIRQTLYKNTAYVLTAVVIAANFERIFGRPWGLFEQREPQHIREAVEYDIDRDFDINDPAFDWRGSGDEDLDFLIPDNEIC